MPSVSSTPSAQTRSPSTLSVTELASRATASASPESIARSAASFVIARYIRPLSMKGRSWASATRFPTADLPEATPPSMEMINPASLEIQAGRPPQRVDLRGHQHPPAARLQTTEPERAEADAGQLLDAVSDRFQHPAHLAVASFADHHPQLDVVRVDLAQDLDLRGRRRSVFQLHAVAKPVQVLAIRGARDHGQVLLGDLVARVCEAERKI